MTSKTSTPTNAQPNRRQFLQAAGAAASLAATGIAAPATIMAQEAKGANERIGVGFIGVGGRCQTHIDIVNS